MQLTKRTNILFDETLWQELQAKSKQESVSVGALVRQAVREVYKLDDVKVKTQAAINMIKKIRKIHKHIDYKSLINSGRTY